VTFPHKNEYKHKKFFLCQRFFYLFFSSQLESVNKKSQPYLSFCSFFLFTFFVMGNLFSSPLKKILNSVMFAPPKRTLEEFEGIPHLDVRFRCFDTGQLVPLLIIGDNYNSFNSKKTDNKSDDDNSPHCFIFAHGNACDLKSMYPWLYKLSQKTETMVIAFEYFGYGLATSDKPSERGCSKCCRLAIAVAHKEFHFPLDHIHLIGQSLGTGVVVDILSRENRLGNAMLISPFSSMAQVIADHLPTSSFSFSSSSSSSSSFLPTIFDSLSKIKQVETGVKIVHGVKDTLISIEHGKRLFECLKVPLNPVWIPEADHNNILNYLLVEDVLSLCCVNAQK
jgi:hypothetical protein